MYWSKFGLIIRPFISNALAARLGIDMPGTVMPNFSARCRRARDEGSAAAKEPDASLDQCPYSEEHDPVLRANWQDAFVMARLYGDR